MQSLVISFLFAYVNHLPTFIGNYTSSVTCFGFTSKLNTNIVFSLKVTAQVGFVLRENARITVSAYLLEGIQENVVVILVIQAQIAQQVRKSAKIIFLLFILKVHFKCIEDF